MDNPERACANDQDVPSAQQTLADIASKLTNMTDFDAPLGRAQAVLTIFHELTLHGELECTREVTTALNWLAVQGLTASMASHAEVETLRQSAHGARGTRT